MSRRVVPGDGGGLGPRFFPEPDAFTVEEYHRLAPDEPVPLQPRPPAAPPRLLTCPHCGRVFEPHPLAAKARFCADVCRRSFHARLSRIRKKAVAS
jgi:hypothetical protein